VIGTLLPATYGAVHGLPKPVAQDEFSYLLGADTFVRGRLTNPPPDRPEFFEAPHVLVSPTYSSKYPPGQALILAAGSAVFGHPAWGVWISCGLFSASLCWMLQAWVPRQWALHFSLMAALTLGTAGYWAQSYWGGMVPALGAALVFGGMRRTLRRARVLTSALLALGGVILFNSRPYEGLLVCVPAAVMLVRWLVQARGVSFRHKWAEFIAPVAAVLAVACAWTTVHDRAVTGDSLQLPYALYQRQYFHQGVFLFSTIKTPERPLHPQIDRLIRTWTYPPFHGTAIIREAGLNVLTRLPRTLFAAFGAPPTRGRTFLGVGVWIPVLLLLPTRSTGLLLFVALGVLTVEIAVWRAALGYPVVIAAGIVALFLATLSATRRRNGWLTFMIVTIGTVVAGNAMVWWWFPHYMAPVIPLVIAAAAMTVHRLVRASPSHHHRPQRLAVNTFVLLVVQAAALTAAARLTPPFAVIDPQPTYVDIRRALVHKGGKHLVFVRYGTDYPSFRGDWVYNEADIRSAQVVFAHDLGSINGSLIAAYPDRTLWLLSVSGEAVRLQPLSANAASSR
jgi:hypothetical protein